MNQTLSRDERTLMTCFKYKSGILSCRTAKQSDQSWCLVQLKLELNNAFDVKAAVEGLLDKGLLSQHACKYSLTVDGKRQLGFTE